MSLVLLAIGTAIPCGIALRAMLGGTMFHAKALLLVAEYGLLLPLAILLCRVHLGRAAGEAETRRLGGVSFPVMAAAYAVLLLALGAVCGLGCGRSSSSRMARRTAPPGCWPGSSGGARFAPSSAVSRAARRML